MSNRLIRLPEVILKTGLGRAAIYAKLDSKNRRYDPTFPPQRATYNQPRGMGRA